MEKNVNTPLTFREVYRRHRQVWNTLACSALISLLIVAYGVYLTWFVPLGSEPMISGRVISKIVVGFIVGWILTAIAQKK